MRALTSLSSSLICCRNLSAITLRTQRRSVVPGASSVWQGYRVSLNYLREGVDGRYGLEWFAAWCFYYLLKLSNIDQFLRQPGYLCSIFLMTFQELQIFSLTFSISYWQSIRRSFLPSRYLTLSPSSLISSIQTFSESFLPILSTFLLGAVLSDLLTRYTLLNLQSLSISVHSLSSRESSTQLLSYLQCRFYLEMNLPASLRMARGCYSFGQGDLLVRRCLSVLPPSSLILTQFYFFWPSMFSYLFLAFSTIYLFLSRDLDSPLLTQLSSELI